MPSTNTQCEHHQSPSIAQHPHDRPQRVAGGRAAVRLRQPGEGDPEQSRGHGRHTRDHPPVDQVGEQTRARCRDRDAERRRCQDVRQRTLAHCGRPHVTDVDERGRDERGETAARHRAADPEGQQVRGEHRPDSGDRRTEQRQAHHADAADAVADHAPHRLHQAVRQEVRARHAGDGRQGRVHVETDHHEQGGDRESVAGTGQGGQLQQPQPPSLPHAGAHLRGHPTTIVRHRRSRCIEPG